MIVRVFSLILIGVFSPGAGVRALDPPQVTEPAVGSERFAGFETVEEAREPRQEDPAIFAPLSPITVEAETVKLPDDQSID